MTPHLVGALGPQFVDGVIADLHAYRPKWFRDGAAEGRSVRREASLLRRAHGESAGVPAGSDPAEKRIDRRGRGRRAAQLRTLDAIPLASALSICDELTAFVAGNNRLTAAAGEGHRSR